MGIKKRRLLRKEKGVRTSSDRAAALNMQCAHCSAPLSLDLDNLMKFCPYCGTKILVDPEMFRDVLVEKEKTKRAGMKYDQERESRKESERKRVQRLKLAGILFLVGGVMTIAGMFAGEASGDPNSAWDFVALIGYFPLFGGIMLGLSILLEK